MVCIYCFTTTKVVNSRRQRRTNNIWRRRKCLGCGAVFTTNEKVELETSLMIKKPNGRATALTPFSRDQLMINIYESCRHRASAANDAAALTQTVVNDILPTAADGVIDKTQLIKGTAKVLKHFDPVAATIYAAYHPLPEGEK